MGQEEGVVLGDRWNVRDEGQFGPECEGGTDGRRRTRLPAGPFLPYLEVESGAA